MVDIEERYIKATINEIIGGFSGGIIGGIVGYNLGSEAVEYSKQLAENLDVLSYMVSNHPILTKFTSTYLFGNIGYKIGSIPGRLEKRILEGKINLEP